MIIISSDSIRKTTGIAEHCSIDCLKSYARDDDPMYNTFTSSSYTLQYMVLILKYIAIYGHNLLGKES